MKWSKAEIVAHLRNLNIEPGDSICVHSSFKSIGDAAAETVIEALIDAVGDSGTVMFPAFTFYFLNEENPLFIYEESPSCVGYLSELFRQKYAQKRSLHISHSYSCCGKKTDFYLNHPLDITPCGAESPLAKLMADDGKIVMIGCSYNSMTAVHVIEEALAVPYVKFKTTPVGRVSKAGTVSRLPSKTVYSFGYNFERLIPYIEKSNVMRKGRIGDAESMVFSGLGLINCVTWILRENPNFLSTATE